MLCECCLICSLIGSAWKCGCQTRIYFHKSYRRDLILGHTQRSVGCQGSLLPRIRFLRHSARDWRRGRGVERGYAYFEKWFAWSPWHLGNNARPIPHPMRIWRWENFIYRCVGRTFYPRLGFSDTICKSSKLRDVDSTHDQFFRWIGVLELIATVPI